jgi:8-amino-7-oxononanoate synthase
LMSPRDLVIHDSLIHNCIIVGARLSGATRRFFPHNDLDALREMLAAERDRYDRALIATEGLFSMDGDGPDLARLLELKEEFGCWLLVDDAHGLGVLGRTGLGSAEHAGIDPRKVDIWLGTLSKALVSCGGYVAGSQALVDFLKFYAPGMVYSVGLPVPTAVAALKALELMRREVRRVRQLQKNSQLFHRRARELGFDVGLSWGCGVLPLVIGDALRTARLAERLLARGISTVPVLPPGVPENSARLRFFVLASHTPAQLEEALLVTREELDALLPPERAILAPRPERGIWAKTHHRESTTDRGGPAQSARSSH